MSQIPLAKLKQMIEVATVLSPAERQEWLQVVDVMNDQQRQELMRIITAAPPQSSTSAASSQPARQTSVHDEVPASVSPKMSHIANMPPSVAPMPTQMLEQKLVAPAMTSHTAGPLPGKLPVRPAAEPAAKPATALQFAATKGNQVTPATTVKPESKAVAAEPKHVANANEIAMVSPKTLNQMVGAFKLGPEQLADLSKLQVENWRQADGEQWLKTLSELVHRQGYWSVMQALKASSLFRAYINCGLRLLQNDKLAEKVEMLEPSEFMSFVDLLHNLRRAQA